MRPSSWICIVRIQSSPPLTGVMTWPLAATKPGAVLTRAATVTGTAASEVLPLDTRVAVAVTVAPATRLASSSASMLAQPPASDVTVVWPR